MEYFCGISAFERYLLMQFEELKTSVKDIQQCHLLLNSKIDMLVWNAGLCTSANTILDDVSFLMWIVSEIEDVETRLENRNFKDSLVSLKCMLSCQSACSLRSIDECYKLDIELQLHQSNCRMRKDPKALHFIKFPQQVNQLRFCTRLEFINEMKWISHLLPWSALYFAGFFVTISVLCC